MDNKVYIYSLTDPRDGLIKYIGKTNNPKERQRGHNKDKNGKNKRINWIKSLRSKGFAPLLEVIDIVDEKNWEFWEKYWISQFKAWGFILKNNTDGGEKGKTGYRHSKEAKLKISLAGENRKVSIETRNKMSNSKKGIVFSDVHLKNLSLSHKSQDVSYLKTPVIKIDRNTGKILNKYNSITDAENDTKINNSLISRCCNKQINSTGGFYWCYADKYKNFLFIPYKRVRDVPKSAKTIQQINIKNNTVVNIFRSIKNASDILKIQRKTIHRCLDGLGKTAGGFYWKYAETV